MTEKSLENKELNQNNSSDELHSNNNLDKNEKPESSLLDLNHNNSIDENDKNIDSSPTCDKSIDVKKKVESEVPKTDIENENLDIKKMTIRNLDTGEEFVIGENDPDFDFDTFEIRGDLDVIKKSDIVNNDPKTRSSDEEKEKLSWFQALVRYFYGSSKYSKNERDLSKSDGDNLTIPKPKTPFTKLSSFKFRKELGKGAFGRVLLAEAKTDGKLYALKIISKKNMRNSDKRQAKAERDILFAMALKSPHPFTSGLKFAFQSENNLYLGMDYIPGGNLRELIKRFTCLPESWVQFYAAELVLAISHLHSLKVLYRDIKPHNVMIDARGHAILIDFGLSKQEISSPRGALSLVGTPDYSAPEVLKTGVQQIEAHNREKALAMGKKLKKSSENTLAYTQKQLSRIGYGKAADWWSLGIMIYEMLSGKPTFRGSDLRQTYQKILYANLQFVPEEKFSLAARNLLEGLIQRDPSIRLGAWDNPPKDIMSSSFFNGIDWDIIYERRHDGPWIPEIPSYVRKRSMASTDNNNAKPAISKDGKQETIPSDGLADDFKNFNTIASTEPRSSSDKPHSRPPSTVSPKLGALNTKKTLSIDKEGASVKSAEIKHDKNRARSQSSVSAENKSLRDRLTSAEQSVGESNADTEDGKSESEDEQVLHVRDSVIINSRGKNKLLDWSFIDEQILKSALENKDKSSNEKTPKKKSKKSNKKQNKKKN